MQIPEHWAEARVVGRVQGKDRVVRRFGWSESSAEQAQQMAEARASAALAELQAGRPVAPREKKRAYGIQGLPIREQVLARNGDLVVTRNWYGARCLNEPDVLFADIDWAARLPAPAERALTALGWAIALLCFCAALVGYAKGSPLLGCSALVACVLLPVSLLIVRVRLRQRPGTVTASQRRTIEQVQKVVAALPRSRFALYDTPAGLRLLALHATFDPTSATTQALLRDFGGDPAYAQMCELQACFRARVSGKPWRMGVRAIQPRPGVWPVHPDRLALREAWIAEYEAAALKFAACRFRGDLGDGEIHPRCAAVQRVHDELSSARSNLPIA